MNKTITLDKNNLASIMLGAVIGSMTGISEIEIRRAYRDHTGEFRKMAQDIINKHGDK